MDDDDTHSNARAFGIIALIAAFIFTMMVQPLSAVQTNPCDSAAVQYLSKCNELNSWLDQRLVEWKPVGYTPMNFGVYHVFASDNMFVKSNAAFDIKMLDALEEVNPDTVVLYIRPGAYFSEKDRYDALISRIRNDGKKLFIGARFDDISMDFNGYGSALEDYTNRIIAAIKPDYFGIVIEPMTMEQKYNFNATDEQWLVLVDRIAILSKQLSPATKTVAGGHKEELNFLRLASDLASVDIIGFDIYETQGLYPEYSGYLGNGDVVGNAIDFVNSKGKETWILETWTAAMVTPLQQSMGIEEFMKPIDAKWVRVLAYYAQRHNMNAIVPFYTGKFVYYGTDSTVLQLAIDGGQRTPVFYEYKSVISEVNPLASVYAPVFSPSAGTYTTAQSVTISTATTGATIHYTLDGTTPTEASAIYSSPIMVSLTTTTKAGAWKSGMTASPIATAMYNIRTPVLASITVSPSSASIATSTSQQFSATPKDQFGNPMAATITWSSSNTSVGTISSSGLFTALASGTSTITASNGSISGTATTTVTSVTVPCTINSVSLISQCSGGTSSGCEQGEQIKIDTSYSGTCPSTSYVQIAAKSSDSLCNIQATGGNIVGIQTICTSGSCTGYWTVPVISTACQGKTVSAFDSAIYSGNYPNNGGIYITGKQGSFGSFVFVAAAPVLTLIAVAPLTISLSAGTTQQFSASPKDQFSNPISAIVLWSSSNTAVGTISSSGLFTSISPGSATITSSAGGVSGTATVTVTTPLSLAQILISPTTITAQKGGSYQFTAYPKDQNGNAYTTSISWASSNTTVGTITSSGLFTAITRGDTVITASSGSISKTVDVKVIELTIGGSSAGGGGGRTVINLQNIMRFFENILNKLGIYRGTNGVYNGGVRTTSSSSSKKSGWLEDLKKTWNNWWGK